MEIEHGQKCLSVFLKAQDDVRSCPGLPTSHDLFILEWEDWSLCCHANVSHFTFFISIIIPINNIFFKKGGTM